MPYNFKILLSLQEAQAICQQGIDATHSFDGLGRELTVNVTVTASIARQQAVKEVSFLSGEKISRISKAVRDAIEPQREGGWVISRRAS